MNKDEMLRKASDAARCGGTHFGSWEFPEEKRSNNESSKESADNEYDDSVGLQEFTLSDGSVWRTAWEGMTVKCFGCERVAEFWAADHSLAWCDFHMQAWDKTIRRGEPT